MMNQRIKDKLRKAGRQDLIDAFEIKESGYGGILANGNIVDVRKHPEAIPFPNNTEIQVRNKLAQFLDGKITLRSFNCMGKDSWKVKQKIEKALKLVYSASVK
jgi:hypothetical protein